MSLLKKEYAKADNNPICSYAPIARALSKLPELEMKQLRVKFDLAYFIAKEKIAFSKYSKLCELEARHGVTVGSAYTNEAAGKTFVHYIAETKKQELAKALAKAKYFSLLMDGSTDSGNNKNELLMVVYCDVSAEDEKVHTKTEYFQVIRPSSVAASGLYECVTQALTSIGISAFDPEHCSKLVGFGTDGASANIAKEGLRGLVKRQLPWIFWMWCLAHRVELAGLKGTTFDLIDDMLLKLYYIRENSPNK